MDYTKHHATSTQNLILPQLDRQDQLQRDIHSKKALLGPSTPAPCWVARRETKTTNIVNVTNSPQRDE